MERKMMLDILFLQTSGKHACARFLPKGVRPFSCLLA